MANNVIVGGIASILVVACVVAACVTLTKHGDDTSSSQLTSSTKSVESMCQPTPYKETCEKTLSATKNVTEPKDYIKVTFEAAVTDIKNAIMNTEPIKKAASDPYTKDALHACEELFDLAIEDLRGSVSKLDNFDFTKIKDVVDDLKTWLSAVVAYEETCLDAFSESEQSEIRDKMVKLMNTTRELSINGLAMVNSFGEMITQTTGLSRKLLTTTDSFVEASNRWAPWNTTDFGLHTCWYAEYQNRGPGAALNKRVSHWRGYQKGVSGDAINKFTAGHFINTQDAWLPKANIPYEAGMMKV
ncbi:hypothetical protein HAX54_020544 [Datura stramonium]|uniref:Pectinesterase inhibitor domain-containing protein n=1 Tax=Datura stramonium TaxID=4076 RepID=A0ABS8USG2_DATST|nr:hypothetical protein [Datura stramonium]